MERTASMYLNHSMQLKRILTVTQSIAERDHANDIQAIHRKIGGGVEADLQGKNYCQELWWTLKTDRRTVSATPGVPNKKRLRASH